MIICRNFTRNEIKYILCDKMKIHPVVLFEVLMRSNLDKFYVFGDNVHFFNIVIPDNFKTGKTMIVSLVRKKMLVVGFIYDYYMEEEGKQEEIVL